MNFSFERFKIFLAKEIKDFFDIFNFFKTFLKDSRKASVYETVIVALISKCSGHEEGKYSCIVVSVAFEKAKEISIPKTKM